MSRIVIDVSMLLLNDARVRLEASDVSPQENYGAKLKGSWSRHDYTTDPPKFAQTAIPVRPLSATCTDDPARLCSRSASLLEAAVSEYGVTSAALQQSVTSVSDEHKDCPEQESQTPECRISSCCLGIVVQEFRAEVPRQARSFYYRDDIGNISTSSLRYPPTAVRTWHGCSALRAVPSVM